MKGLKIKKEFLDTTISFNGSGLPLKFRKDLHLLAKIGLNTKDDLILRVFESVPTAEQIKEYEGELFLHETESKNAEVPENTQTPTSQNNDEKSESKDDKDKPKNTSKSGK